MSGFSKLFGLAQKALDGAASKQGAARGGSGQGDWRDLVRNAADALTGDGRDAGAGRGSGASRDAGAEPDAGRAPDAGGARSAGAGAGAGTLSQADRAAIARYDYLLQTADPQQIEQVHREAFARLTPEQRQEIENRMYEELPEREQPRSSSPGDLARAAARTEAAEPGRLRGLLARVGRGRDGGERSGGFGRAAAVGGAAAGAGLLAGGALAAVAGGAIVSSVAGPLLEQAVGLGVDFDALASGIDVESIASGIGLEGLAGVDELAAGAGETVSGLGEQVSGLGEQIGGLGSGFGLPGLDDLFGR
ncbi:hypothetical protein N1031_13250 [Herbiconiux moechotypicola]|uniref:Cation-transporting ATPase n=1 Tax=Herbiconiux moechotypicola TaxID=637393 RepID=A0ABP5R7Z6_9MICO|nr:hypothetical protein [Herbiconiux moechotypicola]MCS5730730.1 hypothetical protein [Herbiconiux moechotypicola]